MDLSTISIGGIIALVIICVAVITAIVVIGKTFKKMSFKMGNNSLDIGGSSPAPKSTKLDASMTHRKCQLAKTHARGLSVALERMGEIKIGRPIEDNVSHLIFELLKTRLEMRIIDNVVENHIGDTPEELNAYIGIRSREYATAVISFYDEFYPYIPEDMKSICDQNSIDKLEEFFKNQLTKLFYDIKSLEKMK